MKSLVSIFGAAAVALVLAGCGGPDEPADEAPEAVNGTIDQVDGMDDAGQDDEDAGMTGGDEPMTSAGTDPEFIDGCLLSSNMSREMCTCLAASARVELSDNAQDFLVAMLNQRGEEAAEIRARMSIEEVTSSAMFMTNATRDCAERGFNQ